MTEIDVVILNWNGVHFLERFIPHLIRHTPPELARIIVADNGSTDGSVEWLEKNHQDNIRIIKLEKNYGFAEGYNRALAELDGKYTVIINSDVEVTEGWLDPLIKAANDADVAAVMPKIKSLKEKDHFEYAGASGGYIDRWGFPFCRGRILNRIERDDGQYDDPCEIFWATGACMMIKTHIFREEGGFDEYFFAHMEEIDLCWRIKSKGYRILSVPDSTVYHLGGGTLPSGNKRKIFLNVRNSLLTLYKNLPSDILLPMVLKRMIFDGMAAIFFLISGKGGSFTAILKAHLDFYGSRKMYRERRKNSDSFVHPKKFKGYYHRSIIIDYYLRGIRTFSKLKL